MLSKKNSLVRKNVNDKSLEVIQKVRHSRKRKREVDKKRDKKYTYGGKGEGGSQKRDGTLSKNDILQVTFFLNDPYDADLFCYNFFEYFVDDIINFFMKEINQIANVKYELYIQNKMSLEQLDHDLKREYRLCCKGYIVKGENNTISGNT